MSSTNDGVQPNVCNSRSVSDNVRQCPLVSVMVPTYNQADHIGQCIESVLRQTYRPIEIIVCDDCSTDSRVGEVLGSFDTIPFVRVVRHPQNKGRVSNYRHCLYHEVKGEFAINVDGDDLLGDRFFLSRAVEILQSDEQISMVTAGVKRFSDAPPAYMDGVCGTAKVSVLDGSWVFKNYYRRRQSIHHLTTVYRSDLAKLIDFYRIDVVSSDVESILRMLLGYKVVRMHCRAGYWRFHGNNASIGLSVDEAVMNLTLFDSIAKDRRVLSHFSALRMRCWLTQLRHARIHGSFSTHFVRKRRAKDGLRFLRAVFARYPLTFVSLAFDPRFMYYLLRCCIQLFLRDSSKERP